MTNRRSPPAGALLRWLSIIAISWLPACTGVKDVDAGAGAPAGSAHDAAAPAAAALAAPLPSTAVPTPRDDQRWHQRHEQLVARAREGDHELVFLGDSITEGWAAPPPNGGREVWEARYASRHALNLGIGGDRTQHVLWRLDHGLLDALAQPDPRSPVKAVVLMVGTNNSNGDDNSAEEIAAGIAAIVSRLRERLPGARVLLLAIFPRGEHPGPQREKNAAASSLARQLVFSSDGQRGSRGMIHYLDLGPGFLAADGTLSRDIMPDFLHLSDKGYEIWAAGMEPVLKQWLQ